MFFWKFRFRLLIERNALRYTSWTRKVIICMTLWHGKEILSTEWTFIKLWPHGLANLHSSQEQLLCPGLRQCLPERLFHMRHRETCRSSDVRCTVLAVQRILQAVDNGSGVSLGLAVQTNLQGRYSLYGKRVVFQILKLEHEDIQLFWVFDSLLNCFLDTLLHVQDLNVVVVFHSLDDLRV